MVTRHFFRRLRPEEGEAAGKFKAQRSGGQHIRFFFFLKAGCQLHVIFLWVRCLTKGDVTRDDPQGRVLLQHSVTTLLQHCSKAKLQFIDSEMIVFASLRSLR